MKTHILTILSIATLSMLASCSRLENFVGKYSSTSNGKPEVEITKRDGKFVASIQDAGRWSSPEQLSPVTPKDIQQLFGPDAKIVQDSLGKDSFAIFRVKKGAVVKDLGALPSDYLVMFLVPRAVYKLP